MWTFSTISLVVMLGVVAAGGVGFAAGWLTRRAIVEERRKVAKPSERYSAR